jgi:LysM repeat protein
MLTIRFKSVAPLTLLLILMLGFSPAVFAQDEPLTHIVQPGENLFRIALRYGVDMNELARTNNITDQRRIFSGQTLVIPGLSTPDNSVEVVNPLVAGTPTVHVVQRGESLTTIARRYNVTVEQILQVNDIPNPNRIHAGTQLNVWTAEPASQVAIEPESAPAEFVEGPAPMTTTTYVVQPGETLSLIARRYGMNWTVLAQVNGITNPDHVYAGQTLTIPAGGSTDVGIIAPPIDAPAPTITQGKQIIISLNRSRIYAYENGHLVRNVLVSTGRAATPTVQGDFTVIRKVRAQRMVGPGYNLPNVEWVMYFYQAYAIHGTYWHNNFGTPMSYGCVNLPNSEAEWFYNWAEMGTPVRVQVA